MVAGASGAGSRATGSALYTLGSLFNHSCVPNLDVLFPAGNGAACGRMAGALQVLWVLRYMRSACWARCSSTAACLIWMCSSRPAMVRLVTACQRGFHGTLSCWLLRMRLVCSTHPHAG